MEHRTIKRMVWFIGKVIQEARIKELQFLLKYMRRFRLVRMEAISHLTEQKREIR